MHTIRRWARRNDRTEAIMNDQSPSPSSPTVVDQKGLAGGSREALFAREKARTREGDTIAADSAGDCRWWRSTPLSRSSVLTDRSRSSTSSRVAAASRVLPRLVARPTCRGAMRGLHVSSTARSASCPTLTSRDATYATLCKGPYEEGVRYRDFLGLDMPWYSVERRHRNSWRVVTGSAITWSSTSATASGIYETYYTSGRGVEIMAPTHGLLDMTVYGRQETWERSPTGSAPTFGVTPNTPRSGVRMDARSPNGPASRPGRSDRLT